MLKYVSWLILIPVFWLSNYLLSILSILLPSCAQAALDHLSQRSDIDTSRIVVFGRSLGGAVGAVLTKNNPDKVPGLWSAYFNAHVFLGKILRSFGFSCPIRDIFSCQQINVSLDC